MMADGAWLRVRQPAALDCLPGVCAVLFDFDGTISLLRAGWERVMMPLMVEMICGAAGADPAIEREVAAYVDASTGVQTSVQMAWLAQAVARYGPRYGLDGHALAPAAYESLYRQRLAGPVERRVARVACGEVAAEAMLVPGVRAFLAGLAGRGIPLYLASGSDHEHVVREAHVLGVAAWFRGIYGGLPASDENSKEHVVARILAWHSLAGPDLLVVGDGPAEMRCGAERGAITLGVASDDAGGGGWNEHKVARLQAAGAALLVPDFSRAGALLGYFDARSRAQQRARSIA